MERSNPRTRLGPLYRLALLAAVTLLCFVGSAQAVVITSATGGPFQLPSTWVGGVVPTPIDDVIIAAGHEVSLVAAISELQKETP